MPVMSAEWQKQNQDNKIKWFKGNQSAIDFVNHLFYAVEFWDDLIDKDVEISNERINEVMTILFIGLTSNNWFIDHREYYHPLIIMAINGFNDANKMAKDSDDKIKNLAFHIRNLGTEIQIATAFLIGGFDYMNSISEEIRRFYAFEDYKDWIKCQTQ